MRKLLDGTEVTELEQAKILTLKTKCPEKWLLIDKETGEVYNGYITEGTHSWKKVEAINWPPLK